MDGKVDLGKVVGGQLDALELLVGFGALLSVLLGKTFGQAAAAVLASATAFAGLGLTLWS